MTQPPMRALHLVSAAAPVEVPKTAAPDHAEAFRVEVWVSTPDSRPWLASSAIVATLPHARIHATQAVAGLLTDGVDPDDLFVGAIRGQVHVDRASDLNPGWEPHPREQVAVTVIDDGDRLGMWVFLPQHAWLTRTGRDDIVTADPEHGHGRPQAPGAAR